ncbi:MAG: dTDP-4-dehydrorhamnose reductase [Bacteroidia bacterium]|nr:dTDP-4-dehydrorhamnose reductase [Bacteroidia bacterium]
MSKILVTGCSGQMGHDVSVDLIEHGYGVLSPSHVEMDLSDFNSIKQYLDQNKPSHVIHCAAWTKVDLAEDDPDACRAVNVTGTRALAEWCHKNDVKMLYISTDYVFPGTGDKPWTVDDQTDPINVYGMSKRDGEESVRKLEKYFIVRVSWVFGINGNNFVKTMIALSKKYDKVRVVADQYGSLTYTADLAPMLRQMMESDRYGTYHACNSGICTWYDVACEIFRLIGADVECIAIPSSEYPMRAKRPLNSRLDMSSIIKNGFDPLPDWKDALERYIKSIYDEDETRVPVASTYL